jgi:hypothetical protein
MTPAVINETVKAARDYLHSPAGEKEYKKLPTLVGEASRRCPPRSQTFLVKEEA